MTRRAVVGLAVLLGCRQPVPSEPIVITREPVPTIPLPNRTQCGTSTTKDSVIVIRMCVP